MMRRFAQVRAALLFLGCCSLTKSFSLQAGAQGDVSFISLESSNHDRRRSSHVSCGQVLKTTATQRRYWTRLEMASEAESDGIPEDEIKFPAAEKSSTDSSGIHELKPLDSSPDELGSRRRFLSLAASLSLGGLVAATESNAATDAAASAPGSLPLQAIPMSSNNGMPNQQNLRRLGGLPSKIRKVGRIMDELQRDLMQERWDLVEEYPAQLRSYVPVFTTYTDSAFPSDAPTDNGLRVALRYEVGRFFASVQRLKQATSRRALEEAYIAYSDMSLHFDRYLHVGGLYSYYDENISTEPYFKGISDDALVFANPTKDPPLVRDLVVLVKGPEKGKTGILIGQYPDGSQKMVVKLDRFKGMREIRVVSSTWVAKRLGEQDPDDVFLIPRK